ncbi:dihydroorotase [Thermococcus waiotapuensis]|uniref:Dihydroorotase n=1 Tax=Thermococcus waiotapuensis TaxID=90909 RepID=A0AAE4NTQ2_9EURY|nr:dihydroorotase [Thermococcus waiotapuensis]MDV3104143.1 dihydroorotase [Thermococcus waiotapuensis]
MEDLVIEGRFLFEGKITQGQVGIRNGRISDIKKTGLKGEKTLVLKSGQILLPGLIDVHVHLRDFEQSNKETIESGTMAALHGGITAVFDMPNTKPPVMDVKTFKMRLSLLEKKSYSDFAVGFLISGNCNEAKEAGADFYKAFMGASTGGIYSEDFAMDYSCSPGVLSVHAEDQEEIRKHPERPPSAEIVAVKKVISLAESLKKPVNICHVSTREAMEEILSKELPWVSFEVTPHHLFLTEKDYRKNPLLKVYPPLRDEEHRRYLWENFSKIPIIASDHAPHTLEDKANGAAGIPGLETEVALLLDAINRGLLTLQDIVEKMNENPIRIFGIKGKGFKPGADADFIVVDMKREWIVRADDLYTKAGWTPWEGKRLRGKVTTTILRGKVVMEEDTIVEKPMGVRLNVRRNGDSGDMGSS